MAKKQRKASKGRSRRKSSGGFWMFIRRILLAGLVIGVAYSIYLDFVVRGQFEGRRWAIPARVYARPLELYEGLRLSQADLIKELQALNYQRSAVPGRPGSFAVGQDSVALMTRPFTYWDGSEVPQSVRVLFTNDTVRAVENNSGQGAIGLVRLDPVRIASIYPSHNEDRILVKLDEVPKDLISALLVIEDRDFYQHYGVAPKAIARAMWQNIRAGEAVQGGSTLTQQLVKNFFLTSTRSLVRKGNEAIMALLLEAHYDKDEILQAYLNEVYLGQSGKQAIHGFGLASQFYFGRTLQQLDLSQKALLAAMVKGPSFYDPRRHPQRTLTRRNLVLDVMFEQGLISKDVLRKEKIRPLAIIPKPHSGSSDYPAFMQLVRRQLQRDYKSEDLASEGLQIFTTFDPQVQWQTERAVSARINSLETSRKLEKGILQAAAVITTVEGAEVLAVIGDRNPRYAGFNRALDAIRPIGSLIKPAVYLAALEKSSRFTLATVLNDSPLSMQIKRDEVWQPLNYDKKFLGDVLLYDALVQSRNIPSIRLAQQVGIENVASALQRLGVQRPVHAHASLALGTAAFSPVEMAQVYQTFAAGGFRSPLRAIREVLNAEGKPLQRYPLTVEQAYSTESIYLLNDALQAVTRTGTASKLTELLPAGMTVAGKTGTTDDARDSWFAGFSGDRVAVVWVGADDNSPIGLTGSSGAMLVWRDIFARIATKPFQTQQPEAVDYVTIDRASGKRGSETCADVIKLPFIRGSAPDETAPCAGGGVHDTLRRAFDWLGG